MSARHFLSLLDCTPNELKEIIYHAVQLKAKQQRGEKHPYLPGKNLAMIFEKSSTRTRVSFEVGMTQLGGHALFLSSRDTQLGRGEPIADTARVLSRMVDFIMVRNDSQAQQIELAKHSQVPVINALSDLHHPCQLLADMQTFFEMRGDIAGKKVAWIGDGNNVCHSFIHAARQFNFELTIATPENYQPNLAIVEEGLGAAVLTHDPHEAAEDADLIVTDVWASMGDESESQIRLAAFKGYQVDSALMARAQSDAIFMHCLPAHRGEEVSAEVMDGTQSVVWQEAENRLHAQKALLIFLNQF